MLFYPFQIRPLPPELDQLAILMRLTMDDMEARLGKGRVVIGGHPNSGRVWSTKAFEIGADGFDRDKNGCLLTDEFSITQWKGNAAHQYPFTLLPGLTKGAVLSIGSSPVQLEQVLLPSWKRMGVKNSTESTPPPTRFTYSTKSVELTLTGNFKHSHLIELILWIDRSMPK